MSMRVLLTGATGFIGSHVARELLRRGHEVHAITRPSSDRARIRDLEGTLKLHEGAFDEPPVQADVTLHLAWTTEPGKYINSPENGDLLDRSRRLLDRVRGRAVFAGTCFEFDTTIGTLREDSPTKPTNPYAQSKDALRKEVEKRPNAAWMRFFYQYGPWEDARRFVPSIIGKLGRGEEVKVSPGEQQRDYLHVEDVASATCAVAESDLTGCVNVGSGQGPTVKDIVSRLGDLAGRRDLLKFGAVPYWDGEPMKIVADITRLRSTGWAPRYDLDAGLRHAFEWWRGR